MSGEHVLMIVVKGSPKALIRMQSELLDWSEDQCEIVKLEIKPTEKVQPTSDSTAGLPYHHRR